VAVNALAEVDDPILLRGDREEGIKTLVSGVTPACLY